MFVQNESRKDVMHKFSIKQYNYTDCINAKKKKIARFENKATIYNELM